MNLEDYNKFYIQGSDHYLIPKDVFKELFDEMSNWRDEVKELKKQLEYLRSREYYNQLRFERDMLQYVVDNGKVSKEDKTFIDMTHRNTELLEVIEEVREYIEDWLFNAGGNGASMNYEDINELLQILDKAKN